MCVCILYVVVCSSMFLGVPERMHVCVCACVCARACVCVCVRVFVCACVVVFLGVFVHSQGCVGARMHVSVKAEGALMFI